jgi:Mrp family chromosome partitioning ATPase/capsular polysaccharide biosynthesis protein
MDDTNSAQQPDYLRPLKARWWLIAMIAVVVAAGTYKYYAGKPVFYESSTSLYMQQSGGISGTNSALDPNFLANQAVLLRTDGVAVQAARLLHYQGDPAALLGLVSAAPESGTDFLTITATTGDPVDAARVANAFAQAYISTQETNSQQTDAKTVADLQKRLAAIPRDAVHADQRTQLASEIAGVQLLMSAPTAPATQISPAPPGVAITSSAKTHALYGLALGLLIGAVLAYVLDGMNRRVKRVDDLEVLFRAPLLAKIPSAGSKACDADPRQGLKTPLAEAFRGLRSALQLRTGTTGGAPDLKTIMVVSAVAGEGKSMVVRQLALAYLEAGNRVVVVDCDLRRPDVARAFKLAPQPGLPEVLVGAVTTEEALQPIDVQSEELAPAAQARQAAHANMMLVSGSTEVPNYPPMDFSELEPAPREPQLSVMPAKSPSWNPAAIFATGRFETVLRDLRNDFDVVIIDTPPLGAVSDAASLLPLVDGVLVVSRLKLTPTRAATDLRSMLESVPHTASVGIVANDVHESRGMYGYAQAYHA